MTAEQTFMEVLEGLKRRGYIFNFIKKNDSLYCSEKDMNFRSYELNITEQFRYENRFEPSKNTIVYAIESAEYGLKGLLVN
jgi:hypothetical protein